MTQRCPTESNGRQKGGEFLWRPRNMDASRPIVSYCILLYHILGDEMGWAAATVPMDQLFECLLEPIAVATCDQRRLVLSRNAYLEPPAWWMRLIYIGTEIVKVRNQQERSGTQRSKIRAMFWYVFFLQPYFTASLYLCLAIVRITK